jgi:ribosomal protein L34
MEPNNGKEILKERKIKRRMKNVKGRGYHEE